MLCPNKTYKVCSIGITPDEAAHLEAATYEVEARKAVLQYIKIGGMALSDEDWLDYYRDFVLYSLRQQNAMEACVLRYLGKKKAEEVRQIRYGDGKLLWREEVEA